MFCEREFTTLGQSIWCDNLSRAMIRGGELSRLSELGVAIHDLP
jgi:hypothetical protein